MCIRKATITLYCHPRSFNQVLEDPESCLPSNKPQTQSHTHTHLTQIPVTPRRRCPRNQPQGFPAVVILQHLYEGQSLGNQVFPSVSLSTPAPSPRILSDRQGSIPPRLRHTHTSQCLSSWPRDPQPGETESLREKWKERERSGWRGRDGESVSPSIDWET